MNYKAAWRGWPRIEGGHLPQIARRRAGGRGLNLKGLALALALAAPALAVWQSGIISDAMTDESMYTAIVLQGGGDTGLSAACGSRDRVLFRVVPGGFILGDGRANKIEVMMRVDRNRALSFSGSALDNSAAGFFPSLELIRQMKKGNFVRVRVKGSARYHDARFTLHGFTRAISLVEANCEMPAW